MKRYEFQWGHPVENVDGEWISYVDHCEAMKRFAAPSASAQTKPVEELAMMVRLLVHALRKAAPANPLSARAVDYLERHGLQGSVLRAAPAPSASPAALTDAGQPCAGVAGELPAQTVGKLTAYIRDLQASAGAPRFFIDHGVIHDRITGRHVHGDRDIEPGVADEAVAMLNDLHARALLAASPADQGEDARG